MEGFRLQGSGIRKKGSRTTVERKEPRGSEDLVFNMMGERVALGPLRRDLQSLYERRDDDLEPAHMLGNMPRPVTTDEELCAGTRSR